MQYDNQFKSIHESYDASLLILDSNNNVIFPADASKPAEVNYDDLYLPQAFSNKKINNQNVICF